MRGWIVLGRLERFALGVIVESFSLSRTMHHIAKNPYVIVIARGRKCVRCWVLLRLRGRFAKHFDFLSYIWRIWSINVCHDVLLHLGRRSKNEKKKFFFRGLSSFRTSRVINLFYSLVRIPAIVQSFYVIAGARVIRCFNRPSRTPRVARYRILQCAGAWFKCQINLNRGM